MQSALLEAVITHYPPPRYVVEPLKTTSHFNVVRIQDTETGASMVAKGIFHIEGNNNLGPAAMNRGFAVEADILSRLPKWWGIGIVAAFRVGDIRIIVTPELPTLSWLKYAPSVTGDRAIATALAKQLRFLHSQHIAHKDLELKNVLLTATGPVIIDFEKAMLTATATDMRADWEKLVGSLRERENTRRIGDFLAAMGPFGRRHSVGGYPQRKTKRTRKSKSINK